MCYIDFPDQFPLETFRSNFAYYACVRLYMYACVPSEIGALQQNVNEHDFYCVAISPAMAWLSPQGIHIWDTIPISRSVKRGDFTLEWSFFQVNRECQGKANSLYLKFVSITKLLK